ncbi:hypothetical protein J2S43_002788 [Catenuloplanes nepalensis]|uniref:T3SS peptide-binding chaperone domain-containing protein n=1 Tax=Catenuloplanes nepalensis TaxID=587533 RepID=A0ABT9MS69_9ACTN|nr:hypothetical protein [Catenuloplanes nepalensis]MDP9794276.1 hypothetical protein [Catenuloplanes nepalensis]
MQEKRSNTVDSWIMVSGLVGQNPGLLVTETHPGSGVHDCLTLSRDGVDVVEVDRLGDVRVPDGAPFRPFPLDRLFGGDDAMALLAGLRSAAGLQYPPKAPPVVANSLTYRVLAVTVAHFRLDSGEWDVRNEALDTAGSGVRLRGFVDAFPAAARHVRDAAPVAGLRHPAQRCWALLRAGEPVAMLSTDGAVFVGDETIHLPSVYERTGGRLHHTARAALGPVLPLRHR